MQTDNEIKLKEIIKSYGNDVLRYAYLYLGDSGYAEDISQQVFIKVYKSLDKFSDRSSVKTWLIRITINMCKDFVKSKSYKKLNLEQPISEFEHSGTELFYGIENHEQEQLIWTEIKGLPDNYKNVVILKYYKDYSNSELAEVLNISEVTVRSRLSRACGKLRSKLEGKVNLD